jgi:hypothetical protein
LAIPDLLYVIFIAAGLLFDHFGIWRSFVRRAKSDGPRARSVLWTSWIALLWTITVPGMALWVVESRPWRALRLTAPHGWRLGFAIALVGMLAIWYGRRIGRIARSQRRLRVRMGAPGVVRLVPHTGAELRLWAALSVSAGCCEEFLFRGYLLCLFQPLLGIWGAAVLSVIVFGVAHSYQGAQGVAGAGAIGTVFMFAVLVTGSLWPAVAMHAIVDLGEGVVAWLVLRKGDDSPTRVSGDLSLTA